MAERARLRALPGDRGRRARPLHRLAPRRARRAGAGGRQDRRWPPGASGIACGVIRNNYFQPAMSGADGGLRGDLGVRPRDVPYHGSGYVALGGPSQEEDLTTVLRAPAADRLPVGADHRRGRGQRPHARAVRRLARARAQRLPARARGRLRLQPRVDARPGLEGPRRGRRRSWRGSRSPASSSTARAR